MSKERDDILKSVGFSDSFLRALHEFEKSIPEIELEDPFDALTDQPVQFDESSDQTTLRLVNDNYNQNLIVRQG